MGLAGWGGGGGHEGGPGGSTPDIVSAVLLFFRCAYCKAFENVIFFQTVTCRSYKL